MYVVDVIPIGRGAHIASLSYFSQTRYERGSIIEIPLRNTTTPGVVLSCEAVSSVKTALRTATFSLRRLPTQKNVSVLPAQLLATVDELASYYAAHAGAILFSLLPGEIKNGTIPLPCHAKEYEHLPTTPELLHATQDERYREYKNIIRQALANKSSVVVVVPTAADLLYAGEILGKGIEKHTVTLTNKLGARALKAQYKKVFDDSHPRLIIASPGYACIDRTDISTVIIEHIRRRGYHTQHRPFLNLAHAVETHAKKYGRRIIKGDLLPPSEEEWKLREHTYQPLATHPDRLSLSGTLRTISIARKEEDKDKEYFLISDHLLRAIGRTTASNGRVFLFAARKGISPIVACMDCGEILREKESGAPLSLHRVTHGDGSETRYVICSVSGKRDVAPHTCPHCQSWRLRERGIGIQQIYDELVARLPETPVTLFDHTVVSTPRKAEHALHSFYKEKGTVLLGTAVALPYLHKQVDTSAVVSMEGLRAIPSWRQQEEMFATLLALREKTKNTLYVQTRSDMDDPLLEQVKKGATRDFYDEELSLRHTYHYPPYEVFIHLAWQGNTDTITRFKETLQADLTHYPMRVYTPPVQGNKKRCYALIRVPHDAWPDKNLVHYIRSLPPWVRVMINPDRIV